MEDKETIKAMSLSDIIDDIPDISLRIIVRGLAHETKMTNPELYELIKVLFEVYYPKTKHLIAEKKKAIEKNK